METHPKHEVISEIFGIDERSDEFGSSRRFPGHNAVQKFTHRVVLSLDPREFDGTSEYHNPLRAFFTWLWTTVSAALYLCSLAASVVVAFQYFDFHQRGTLDGEYHFSDTQLLLDALIATLALLAISHLGNLLAFAVTLSSEEHIYQSVYFMPVLQLRRLVVGMWRTCQCGRGQKARESWRAEAVYAVLGAAEGGLQFLLQSVVIVQLGAASKSWKPQAILVVSLLTCLFAASYNTGRAVLYQPSVRWASALNGPGIAAGTYTFGALLLRSTAFASVVLSARVSGISQSIAIALFLGFLLVPVSIINAAISQWAILKDMRTWTGKLEAVGAFYLCLTLGPMYPVVQGYRNTKAPYRIPLAITALLNLLVDLVALTSLMVLDWGTCKFYLSRESSDSATGAEFSYLSSTLECHHFLIVVGFGIVLSVISGIYFVVSVAGSVQRMHEVEGLISFYSINGPSGRPWTPLDWNTAEQERDTLEHNAKSHQLKLSLAL